jgi:sulfatase maturation enzyme AslB (radical SAM superfamily)
MGVSIDGNKELHDSCRIDLNGEGTYERALAAEMHYSKTYQKSLETKMTLSPQNVIYTFEAVKNLIDIGYISISLNCVYEEGWETSHATILYYELKKLADWLFENDAFRKYRISMFNKDLFSPLPASETQNWCGGVCNGMLSFDYLGNAFPCIRYMGSSLNNKQIPYSIGNVNGLFISEEEKERYNTLKTITR